MPLDAIVVFILALHLSVVKSVQALPKHGKNQNSMFLEPLQLNASALVLFESSRQSYEKQYNHFGRVPVETDLTANDVSLDFELETLSMLRMTPDLFLQRGGIELDSQRRGEEEGNLSEPLGTTWPHVSDYFSIGIDGFGKKVVLDKKHHNRSYRQGFGGQIEIETRLMRPKEVVESPFTKELHSVMNRLWTERQDDAEAEQWSALPFSPSKGIDIHVTTKGDPSASCDECHVQWTAGLPLSRVPSLLEMTTSNGLKMVLQIVNKICDNRVGGCTSDYKALVSLAAWTLKAVRGCGNCGHPKRCLEPWLVRTHFGDLAMHVLKMHGANALDNMFYDVLEAADARRSDQILPNGVVDYLRLPEMAEISGLVFPRAQFRHRGEVEAMQDMPTSPKGLLLLAERMVKHRHRVTKSLLMRGCGIHGKNVASASEFTVADWLHGLVGGKDLMSDYDSPISENSFSHLVWKSMGSWRMKLGSDRVYLECRHTNLCLGIGHKPGAAALIREVGERMLKFEQFVGTERQTGSAGRIPIMRHASQDKSSRAEVKPLGQIF